MKKQPDRCDAATSLANLEFEPEKMRSMGQGALDRVIGHISTLHEQPVRGDMETDSLCRAMREHAPEEPAGIESILDTYFRDLVPRSLNTASPGYMAFIPAGGVFPGALADLIAGATNRFTGVRWAAPALAQLEQNVLEWFRDWMLFPSTAGGLFTTGGSMATFNAILCARERYLGSRLHRGVIYTSEQAHHSVMKSARLAGIFPDQVRLVPVDENFRMRVDALRDAIRSDRLRANCVPFLVVSAAGTTNTGAVDPLDAIAGLCEQEGLWHHVDGAYGAFFHVCEPLRPILAGLSRADSLTLDPHKGLFLPYGTGALLVRDRRALRAAHGNGSGQVLASYLPDMREEDEFYDPSLYGPDLSRGFPGLRVWLTVKLYGLAKLRAALMEKRLLAADAATRISNIPGIAVVAPPQLSLFAFHMTWPGAAVGDENAATDELLERVANRGKIMLSGCKIGPRKLARVCVLSFRTRQEQAGVLVHHVQEEAAAILAPRA